MRIVVIGGYGNFGARVCRGLVRSDIETIAASRDPEKGHREARFDDRIGKARIDLADAQLATALQRLAPDAVIHCAGPFQKQDYRVAFASLAAGAHYIDLADARAFVVGFAVAVGAAAQAVDRLAITGSSTVPALSSAVIDAVVNRFSSIDEIQISIAPGQHAPRGAATAKAVFSYVGRPFLWWKDGSWQSAFGWQELRRFRFSGLGTRWAAACDVPDLQLFPARYPAVKTVEFRAALEVGIQHFFLASVAQLRRLGIPLPLERWAPSLDRLASVLDRFGSDCGGMLVSITGVGADGTTKRRIEWHLTAKSNHGPEIPAMAAILLAAKLSRNEISVRGAMPCMGILSLDDFSSEFLRWDMHTKFEESP